MNNEDILMPSEDAIRKMNDEYSILFSRRSFLKECCQNEDFNEKNTDICTLDFDIIAKAYCMESDIIILLDFLMNKARLKRTRKIIYDVIKIKIKNKNRLCSLYDSISKTSPNYEPKASDNLSYEFLYEEILYEEACLISILESVGDDPRIEKIIISEHSSSAMMTSLRP